MDLTNTKRGDTLARIGIGTVGIKTVGSRRKEVREMAKNDRLVLRVEKGLRAELQKIADNDERSLSWIVRKALEKYCEGATTAKA